MRTGFDSSPKKYSVIPNLCTLINKGYRRDGTFPKGALLYCIKSAYTPF